MLEQPPRPFGNTPTKGAFSTLSRDSIVSSTPVKSRTPPRTQPFSQHLHVRNGEKSAASSKGRPSTTRPKVPSTPLANVLAIGKRGGKDYVPHTQEDMANLKQSLSVFMQSISNFEVEQNCVHRIQHLDEQVATLRNNSEKVWDLKLKDLESLKESISEEEVAKQEELAEIENRFVTHNSEAGAPTKCLKETEEKRQKAQQLKEELENAAVDCFKVYQKNIVLHRKLDELKAETKRKSDQYRLSYEFIQSLARFKVTIYDGKRISGCIIPSHSTIKNSHMFELDLGGDNIESSDWLWEKIDAFSISENLPRRFIN